MFLTCHIAYKTDIPHELGLKALNYITKSGSLIPQRFYKEFLL